MIRADLQRHLAPLSAAVLLLLVAGTLATVMPPFGLAPDDSFSPVPVRPIRLPGAGEDLDGDSYPDDTDFVVGDRVLEIDISSLSLTREGAPYVVVGTQQDQWRFGLGAELEWRHVVDFDPLGHAPGSKAWQSDALRTGVWVVTEAAPGERTALGEGSQWPGDGGRFPQTLLLNVRDDVQDVALQVELRDAADDPHDQLGTWQVQLDLATSRMLAQGHEVNLGTSVPLTSEGGSLAVAVRSAVDVNTTAKQQVAGRWAPVVHFDSEEAFYPVPGQGLERYHGFGRQEPDLRTWDFGFNDGRDRYILLLADFNGDRKVDHDDALALSGIVSESPLGRPTVHAQVMRAHNGAVVVQYWFVYFYDFLPDEAGEDIDSLSHVGDQEFMQLIFPSLEAAQAGWPQSVSYSEHFAGSRVEGFGPGAGPFTAGHPDLYVARGSHANYPASGDNKRLLPAFAGFFDRFDGLGQTWAPGSYSLPLLGNGTWDMGYKWGPTTRLGHLTGTATRPILGHDYRYPMHDPLWWAAGLEHVTPDDFVDLYGGQT